MAKTSFYENSPVPPGPAPVQTLGVPLGAQLANYVFAGPPSGGALLPAFRALVAADLPLFSSTLVGAVPASGGGTANFLRADGTWAAPPDTLFNATTAGDVPASGGGTTNFLRADGTWAAAGGGGTPGGTSGQVQFNNAGAFGGFTLSGDATLNTGTGALTIANAAITVAKLDLTMSPTWTGTHTFSAANTIFGSATSANGSIAGFIPRIQNHGTTSQEAHYSNYEWSNDGAAASMVFSKSRGASIGTHAIVVAQDLLGGFDFYGSDGTNFQQAARIKSWVDGTPAAGTSMPGRLDFWTTPAGATASVERLRIDSVGTVTFKNGATNTLLIGKADATYNIISFNGLLSSSTGIMIEGGGGTDKTLYLNSPTGGAIDLQIGAGTKFRVSSTSIHPAGATVSLGDSTAGHGWSQLILDGKTVTASTPPINATQTWNNVAVTFTGFQLNVTDTTSAAASLLMDLQVGGVSKFSVSKAGAITGLNFTSTAQGLAPASGGGTTNFLRADGTWAAAGGGSIAPLQIIDANNVVQANGVTAQAFRVYNTVDTPATPTNYERAVFDWTTTANTLTIGSQAGGTGTLRDIRLVRAGANQIYLLGSDNYYDAVNHYFRDNGGSYIFVVNTNGAGYQSGAGGAVTQLTSRTTGVTLSKVSGAITLFSAAGSTTAATFTVTNTKVAATDTIILSQKSGSNLYNFIVTAVAAGSFNITFFTTGGTATDAPVVNFNVIKGVTA